MIKNRKVTEENPINTICNLVDKKIEDADLLSSSFQKITFNKMILEAKNLVEKIKQSTEEK